MTKLNTIKQFDKETTKRSNILLSSGDAVKIEQYSNEVALVTKYARDNYPNIADVVKDFKSWTAMTKDVLNHSTNFMKLIFTPEEIADVLVAFDNHQGMKTYWEEISNY